MRPRISAEERVAEEWVAKGFQGKEGWYAKECLLEWLGKDGAYVDAVVQRMLKKKVLVEGKGSKAGKLQLTDKGRKYLLAEGAKVRPSQRLASIRNALDLHKWAEAEQLIDRYRAWVSQGGASGRIYNDEKETTECGIFAIERFEKRLRDRE